MGRKAVLVPAVQQILQEYDIKLTIRQVFYRLVSKGIIPNTLNQYNILDQQLSLARKDGRIPFTAFEDRSRKFIGGERFGFQTAENVFEDAKADYESANETFHDAYGDFNLPHWHNQPNYVEVWLEKDALSGIFQQVTQRRQVRLAPCRGYPSLTFLYEAACHFRYVPKDKQLVILYFGDYDVRGLHIQQNITKTLAWLGYPNIVVKRYALTKEQIAEYGLPPQPSKKKDSMIMGWIETHGDVAWELDALEPNVLLKVIDGAIEAEFDREIWNERGLEVGRGQQEIKKLTKEYFGED